MNFNVIPTDKFKKEAKRLIHKFPSLKNELRELTKILRETPATGKSLGNQVYKIRLAIKSKGKGKSGGGRVITYVVTENKEIFNPAYLIEGKNDGKYLWTHAGITAGWLKEFMRDVNSPRFRFNDFFIGSEEWKIDKLLNLAFDLKVDNLFNVDAHSGGFDLWAGPFWVRPSVFNDHPIEGLNQIVGHTPHKKIRIENLEKAIHHFTDCLWDDYDDVLILDIEV